MFFHLGAELLSSFFNVDTVALSAGNFVYYALILFFFFLNKSLLENSNDEWHSHKVVEQKFKTLHTETQEKETSGATANHEGKKLRKTNPHQQCDQI